MNKSQRGKLRDCITSLEAEIGVIEEIRDEEEEKASNMPESMEEKISQFEENASELEDIGCVISEAITQIQELIKE